jgi:hypothetical protein
MEIKGGKMDLGDIISIAKALPKIPRIIVSIVEEIVRWCIIFQIRSAFIQVVWQLNPFWGLMITLVGLISIFKWVIVIYSIITE